MLYYVLILSFFNFGVFLTLFFVSFLYTQPLYVYVCASVNVNNWLINEFEWSLYFLSTNTSFYIILLWQSETYVMLKELIDRHVSLCPHMLMFFVKIIVR